MRNIEGFIKSDRFQDGLTQVMYTCQSLLTPMMEHVKGHLIGLKKKTTCGGGSGKSSYKLFTNLCWEVQTWKLGYLVHQHNHHQIPTRVNIVKEETNIVVDPTIRRVRAHALHC